MILSAILAPAAVVAALVAYGSLRWLFASDRDSSIGTYLLIGVPALILAVAASAALVQLWRRR